MRNIFCSNNERKIVLILANPQSLSLRIKIWNHLKWPLCGFAEELVEKQCKGGTV